MKPQRDKPKRQQRRQEAQRAEAYPAEVEELVGKTGMRGEIMQVRCKIMDGPDAGKLITRNVKGSVRLKDILMLRETETEARKLAQASKR